MSDLQVSGISPVQDAAVRTDAVQSPASPDSASEPKRPSLYEMMREAREKADAARDRYQVKTPARYGDAPIDAYARLARARTPSQASSAAGYARRRIAQLQSALRSDGENSEQIKAAIAQLRKAVSRAGKKKRSLEQEQLTERRRKKAEEAKQKQKAQRLRHELNKARAQRAIQERGYVHEAVIDSQQQAHLAATRLELRAQAQALNAAASPSLDAAVQGYTAAAAPEAVSGESISTEA